MSHLHPYYFVQSPDSSDDEEDFDDEVYRVFNSRLQPLRKAKVPQSLAPTVVLPSRDTAYREPPSEKGKEQLVLTTRNSIMGRHGINRTIQLLRTQDYN